VRFASRRHDAVAKAAKATEAAHGPIDILIANADSVDGSATVTLLVEGGDPILVFQPDPKGTLPIQPFRMEIIQQAMISVVANEGGTANFRLRGLRIPVAGKTGTAESGSGDPHAWFAGYTMASESTNKPDIAIAVILENQGEGSDWAAPVFQRIIETYYYGTPQTVLWYESTFGVTETPTPLGGIPTETPEP